MDARIRLDVSFDRDASYAPEGSISGPGTVTWESTRLEIEGKTSRRAVVVVVGIVGVLVALGMTVAAAVILEDHGLDLMESRKGPILVGVVALFAMVAAYQGGAWLGDLFLGKRVRWTIPAEHIVLDHAGERSLTIAWTVDEVVRRAGFTVSRSKAEQMRALGRALRR